MPSPTNPAEEPLAGRRLFRLDDEQWRAFVDALNRTVVPKPRLARLLSERSVLESPRTTRGSPPSGS
jgi:uncharacterized protein (DUF1778 family)